jgi:hypothetical protein
LSRQARSLFEAGDLTNNIGKPPEAWRNYSTKVPIPAFRVKRDELKRLYQIINSKQLEYRNRMLATLVKTTSESDDEFEARKEKVHNAFVTSVTATGPNDETVTGNSDNFFDSSSFPEHLKSIFFSTQTVPQAVLNFTPLCNVVTFLDFSRPPLLDFSRLPTLPTPNESNFSIAADDESWFAATKAKLSQFFADRRTSTNWLHRAAVYDILLILAGVPIAIWADFRIVGLINTSKISAIVTTALYIYVFVLVLLVFRVLFSYSRWVFPKVELDSELTSPLRHRGIWGAIFLGLIASFLYDILNGRVGWN